jgi:hypothetical protein
MLYEPSERTYFKVIRQMPTVSALDFVRNTKHCKEHYARLNTVHAIGELKTYASFIVDTRHPQGCELHTICTNGVIVIANLWKAEIVTFLIARPNQIKRYGIEDFDLIRLCLEHVRAGLNESAVCAKGATK